MDKILNDIALHESEGEPQGLRDYPIDGEISAKQLRQLVELGVEVSITEESGRLVLGIGTVEGASMGFDESTHNRMISSRVSVHTHPDEDDVVFDSPSFNDIVAALERGAERTPIFIVHSKGITVCKPAPTTAEEPQQPYVIEAGKALPHASEVAREQRAYAERVGAIALQVSWDDTEEINDILRMINMRT